MLKYVVFKVIFSRHKSDNQISNEIKTAVVLCLDSLFSSLQKDLPTVNKSQTMRLKMFFKVTVESYMGQTHRNSFPEVNTQLHEITYKIISTVVSSLLNIFPVLLSKSSVLGQ